MKTSNLTGGCIKRLTSGITVSAALILSLVVPDAEAKPRSLLPPWPEIKLYRWGFDEPYSLVNRTNASKAATVDETVWSESWSGYALNRPDRTLQAVTLPMATTNEWLLAPQQGALRFWFSPRDWSSAGTLTGTGPGHEAQLLTLVIADRRDSVVWWSLSCSADGNTLRLRGETQEGVIEYLSTDIRWQAGEWRMLSLSYGPDQTTLQIDGDLPVFGKGLPGVPLPAVGTTALIVGTDVAGRNSAGGQFEELTTFDRPLPSWELGCYYQAMRGTAAKGPVSEAEEFAAQQYLADLKALREAGVSLTSAPLSGQMSFGGGGPDFPESGDTNLWLLSPVVQGTNISFTLYGADTSKSYDIYFTSHLQNSNTLWQIIAARGAQGQTNFPNFTNTTALGNIGFFRAFEGDDWDRDGSLNYMDAQPRNSAVSNLTITIESPVHGSNID